ncbi:MAG TPA: glycosyltransferase [Gaiellaceae bacterium]|nr:glycosyltransferase [Gaiellaceae bacterium]
MKLVLFVHSLASDWNHGNAHFLRGIVRELRAAGHEVVVYEPRDAWSRAQLAAAEGEKFVNDLAVRYPSIRYDRSLDVAAAVEGADAVLVHEWNEPWLVAAVGASGAVALFHDTHHRAVTAPRELARFDLGGYAGVLAFGAAVADVYRARGWHDRVWVWHEAADTAVFRPLETHKTGDLVWIGNWGDDERTRELETFLLGPARRLGLRGVVHGVRYPPAGVDAVEDAGLSFGGWLPNDRVPEVFARHRVTVHVPRRPYVEALPGVPTIRVFEALACGIPLVSAPWDDVEGLFRGGDFARVRDGAEMERALHDLLRDEEQARELAARGLETIRARHTCAHRVAELTDVLRQVGAGGTHAPAVAVAEPAA